MSWFFCEIKFQVEVVFGAAENVGSLTGSPNVEYISTKAADAQVPQIMHRLFGFFVSESL